MALNPLIIMAGQQPDIAGGVMKADEAGFAQGQRNRENALQRFQREQGAALFRGDQGALDQFAQFSPEGAFDMRGAQETRQQGIDARSAAAASRVSAQEREMISRALATGKELLTQGPDAFNAGMAQLGFSDDLQKMGITAENFLEFVPAVEASLGLTPAPVKMIEVNDQLVNPYQAGDYRTPEAPDAGFRQLTPEEVAGLGLAPDKSYQVDLSSNKVSAIGGGGVNVSVNNTGPDAGKFNEASARVIVNEMSTVSEAGAAARRSLVQLDRLEGALATTQGGAKTGVQAWLGSKGVATEGLDDVQLAEALISQLVPAQRPPGSGVMSDADLALFKLSLPRLMNTPGGNKKIIDTMRAIAQYDIEMGGIARNALLGEITPREAFDAYGEVANPLAEFSGQTQGAAAAVDQAIGATDADLFEKYGVNP